MKLIIKCVLIFIFALNLNAQEKPIYYIGGWLGYGINFHNGGFSDFPEFPGCCGNYESGIGGGIGLGALFDYQLNEDFILTGRIGWRQLNGLLTSDEVIGNTEIRDFNTNQTVEIVDAKAEYSIDGNLAAISFEPGITYQIMKNFGISAGLDVSYLLNSTFDRVEEIQSPDNIVYLNTGTRQRNQVTAAEIPDANALLFRVYAGANYDFPISENAFISPEIRYYHPLTQIRDDWSVATLHLGVAIKKAVFPPLPVERREIFLRDTSIQYVVGLEYETIELISKDRATSKTENADKILQITTISEKYERKIPRVANLTADLKLVGIDEFGNKIQNPSLVIEEFEVEESFPLLPYIYFKDNSSDIYDSGLNLLDDIEIKSFNPDNLKWNTLEIYDELLNIIAFRMLQNQNANITIVGTNNNTDEEFENIELSTKRAETIRDYFINIWKIDNKRIKLKAVNLPDNPGNNDRIDGKKENQRVEIYSDNWEITKPIYLNSIERVANPPKIEITPYITTDVGINNWSIQIEEEGMQLRSYSGANIPDPILWDVIQSPYPTTERNVNVKMIVNDKIKQSVTVYKDLSLNQLTIKKKRFEMIEDKQIQRYSLIVFDYNKDDLTPSHKRILDELKQNISDDSKVKIIGYTDRTGEAQYNRNLALRRANKIAEYLKLTKTAFVTKGIGNDEEIFDNNLPQGRAYSRTVKIIIETPIK